MQAIPPLSKTYSLVCYPPKSPHSEGNSLLISIVSLIFCIAVVPTVILLLSGAHEWVAFGIGIALSAVYLLGIQPKLVKNAGIRTQIWVGENEIRIQQSDQPETVHPLSACSFDCFDYSGSDEASVASITLGLSDGSKFIIYRRHALEGDFEALLKELKSLKRLS